MTRILTINVGSSSVKFALFEIREAPRVVLQGAVTGIGSTAGSLTAGDGHSGRTTALGPDPLTHASAAHHVLAWLDQHVGAHPPDVVVHRLVHGGEQFSETTRLSADGIADLRQIMPLAPNHLPQELELVDAFAAARPHMPQFACFDTAFHRTLPPVSRTLPVPSTPGLRRYGFHGISYTFLMSALASAAGAAAARGRVILAHLGSGASLAAVRDGASVDTTMGLTPAGGIPMSTRTGDLDPGVLIYLARQKALSIDDLDRLTTRESGLVAISGGNADMRELLAREDGDDRARLAVDVFCYGVRKAIGAFSAVLGGVDTIVFAGGIGEHAPAVRQRACDDLGFLGVTLDARANAADAAVISSPDSRVVVRVIPTDEALQMARETAARLNSGASGAREHTDGDNRAS